MKKRVTISFEMDDPEDSKLYEYIKKKKYNASKFVKKLILFAFYIQEEDMSRTSLRKARNEERKRIRSPAKKENPIEMPEDKDVSSSDIQAAEYPPITETRNVSHQRRIRKEPEWTLKKQAEVNSEADVKISKEEEVRNTAEDLQLNLDMNLIEDGLNIFFNKE